MNMLTSELKKVKTEVRNIRQGTVDMYEEDFIRKRAQEDYEDLSKIKKGEREELDKIIFEFKSKIKLNQSYIADKDKLKLRAKEIKQKRLGV